MGASREAVDAPDVDYLQGLPFETGSLLPEWQFTSSLDKSHIQHGFGHNPLPGTDHQHADVPQPALDNDNENLNYEEGYVEDDYLDRDHSEGDRDGDCGGYLGYRNSGAYDDLENDFEDDYGEHLETQPLLPPSLSSRRELQIPHYSPWHKREPAPTSLAGFSSLQLSDVPTSAPGAHGMLHPVRSDEDLDDGLDQPEMEVFYTADAVLPGDQEEATESHPADDVNAGFAKALERSITCLGNDLEGTMADACHSGYRDDCGTGYSRDLHEDTSCHPQSDLSLPFNESVGIAENFPGSSHEESVNGLGGGSDQDAGEALDCGRRDSFDSETSGFLSDRLHLDSSEIDDLDDIEDPHGDDYYQHAVGPEQSWAGVATHPLESSSKSPPARSPDDENQEGRPTYDGDSLASAGSLKAIDYQPSLTGFDGDAEAAFNDDDSLDDDGVEDVPETKSCSSSPIPTHDHLVMDGLDHNNEMILCQSVRPGLPISATKPMSICQRHSLHQRMALNEIEYFDLDLSDGLDIGRREEVDIDNWSDALKHVRPCQEMLIVYDDLDE
ncbi:hypothetical protein CspeluHIS016_0101830 [Cutaneotrichosporon spelunceum]|uniref:Uncharacterized protein n=1 Tax=Cutaneotrichosporon spelunceum TaxID=1672016 RepID=A0AAD3TN19_9TREE|nr:hypothetical protein CspeluHIS016_0101830 [Cutaneotrichosporon spelunceum]